VQNAFNQPTHRKKSHSDETPHSHTSPPFNRIFHFGRLQNNVVVVIIDISRSATLNYEHTGRNTTSYCRQCCRSTGAISVARIQITVTWRMQV